MHHLSSTTYSFDPSSNPLFNKVQANPSGGSSRVELISSVAQEKLSRIAPTGELPPVDHCPMETQEILDHSLLDTLSIDTIKDFPNIEKLMKSTTPERAILELAANFQGGGLITGAHEDSGFKLDGMFSLPNFLVWESLLKSMLESLDGTDCDMKKQVEHILAGVREMIEYTKDIEELENKKATEEQLQETALKYANKVKDLEPGQSRMFSGGWTNEGGGGGHAILYEYIRNEDQTFDIHIYTSTKFQSSGNVLIGEKLRQVPLVRYSSVPEHVILFNKDGTVRPTFFQHLMELELLNIWNNNHVVDEEDVLEAFDIIEEYRTLTERKDFNTKLEECGAITGQRAGTCVASSTKAWMRLRAGNLGLYKQVIFHTQLRFLVTCYRSLKDKVFENSQEGAVCRRLLRHIARNHLRNVGKAVSGAIGSGALVGADLAKQAQATAYHVLKLVALGDKVIEEEVRASSVDADISGADVDGQRRTRGDARIGMETVKVPVEKGPVAVTLPEFDMINTPDEFLAGVEKLLEDWPKNIWNEFHRNVGNKRTSLNLRLHHLVDQLPLPQISEAVGKEERSDYRVAALNSPFWDGLEIDQMVKLVESFETLTLRYSKNFQTAQDSDEVPTRMYATILPLHVLTHYLSLKIEEKKGTKGEARLENYKIPARVEMMNYLEGLYFSNREEYLRISESLNYYKEFMNKNRGYHIFINEQTTLVNKDGVKKAPGNLEYWKALINSDLALKEKIDQQASERWPDLSREEIEKDYAERKAIYDEELAANKNWHKENQAYEIASEKYLAGKITNEPKKPAYCPKPEREPQRKVNVPLVTKQTMILEEAASSFKPSNELTECGYDYVNRLRRMTFYLDQWLTKSSINTPFSLSAERSSLFSMTGVITKPCGENEKPPELPNYLLQESIRKRLHRKSDHEGRLFLNPFVKRRVLNDDRAVAEGQTLKLPAFPTDPFLTKLLRTCSEWKLTPYQLIFEFRKELDKLKDPSYQSTFFRLFFRSPVLENGTPLLGAGQLLAEDRALVKACKDFIQVGYNHFYNNRTSDGLNGARFFLEFSYFISKYLIDAGKEERAAELDMTGRIEQWLSLEGLTLANAAVLHQYRLLFSSLKPAVTLEINDYINIYQSWIAYNMNPDDGKWKSPLLLAHMRDYAATLTKVLKDRHPASQDLKTLGCGLIRGLDLGLGDSSENWTFNEEKCLLEMKDKINHWQIDLAGGQIYSKGARIGSGNADHPWEKQVDFQQLFGKDCRFEYLALGGGSFTFKHPTLGHFRIRTKEKGAFVIQRQFPENGLWFECVPKPKLGGFPKMLTSGHAYWIPVDRDDFSVNFGESDINYSGYITSLEDMKPRYATRQVGSWTKNGIITEVDPHTGGPIVKGEKDISRTVDYLSFPSFGISYFGSEDEPHRLETFEHKENILVYRDQVTTNIAQVSFPRYTSQEGNSLKFFEENGELVWGENAQYALSKQMPSGLLGTIPNYLHLKSKDGKGGDKVLVPFHRLHFKKYPGPDGEMKIDQMDPIIVSSEERKLQEQWGVYKYMVYDLENRELKPATVEAQLFLAYLYYAQKKYIQSGALIRGIAQNQKLSEMSLSILDLIHPCPLGEDHPDAKMVRLSALLLKMRKMDAASIDKVDNYFGSNELELLNITMNCIVSCLQNLNNISEELRFRKEDEIYLLQTIHARYNTVKLESEKRKNTSVYLPSVSDRRLDRLKARFEYLNSTLTFSHRRQIKFMGFRIPDSKEGRSRDNFNSNLGKYFQGSWAYGLKGSNADTSWLFSGHSSKLCSYPASNVKLTKNGTLLKEIFDIMKGGTEHDKREMLYRLYQWRIHYSHMDLNRLFLDLLIAMLSSPDSFNVSEYPAIESTEEDRKKFLSLLLSGFRHAVSQAENPVTMDSIKAIISGSVGEKGEAARKYPTGQYPILESSVFDTTKKSLSKIASRKQPVPIELSVDAERWVILKGWKRSFITEEKAKDEAASGKDFAIEFSDSLISPGEEDYKESLKQDLELLKMDYDAGKAQNLNGKQWVITQEHCQQLIAAAEVKKKEISRQIALKKADLFKKANVKSDDPAVRQKEEALIGGMVAKSVGFGDCVETLLSMDRREYQLLNPNLNTPDRCKEIARLTLEIEDLKSFEAQLSRIISDATKVERINGSDEATRQYLCQKLCGHLDAEYHFDEFDEEVQVAMRVFSGETGMIPYKKQTDLIKKMLKMHEKDPARFKDIVIQLIMGGGKTSVLATIILYLAAKRKGRMALFIVPSSLFDTVGANFTEGMRRAFHKQVQAIDVEREDLTLHKLKQIQQQLKITKEQAQPLIMKATTIQCFELELLSQIRGMKSGLKELKEIKAKWRPADKRWEALKKEIEDEKLRACLSSSTVTKTSGIESIRRKCECLKMEILATSLKAKLDRLQSNVEVSREKIQALAAICKEFPKCADALMDEVDLLLDCLQEVNFPDGNSVPIKAEVNSLLRHLFQMLVSDDLKVTTLEGAPSINKVVGLKQNRQSLLDTQVYLQHVTPVIAKELSENFPRLREFLEDFNESFIRYVTGRMPEKLQTYADDPDWNLDEAVLDEEIPNWKEYGTSLEIEVDVEFLRYMKSLSDSEFKEQNDAANIMAHTRHILLELTPAALSKSGNRDYGPSRSSKTLKIIPYLAVDTPATTEFGYYLEEACYYYQWAMAFPVAEQDVLELAAMAEATARYYVEKNGERYEDTVEYQEFFRLFGVSVDAIHKPGMLQKAVKTISADFEKRLDLIYETVSQRVSFRSERLTSNGMALIDQLASRRTMSGTPWNVEGYAKSLVDRYKADTGTEGKILHTMAMRAHEGAVHEVEFDTIEKFFNQIFKDHPTPKKIRGIIETGGIFKVFENNAGVARNIMNYLAAKQADGIVDPSIEGVLFFHRDPGQSKPDTLYVWRKGAHSPDRIGSSSQENLRAKGLDPKKYFVYYDERHTTGTDILQVPDAINLLTFDEKMLRRTIGQGTMRLRQYLYSQDVELVVTKATREMLVSGGKTFGDFILSAEKYQSMRKTRDLVRFFRQQIDNIFRRYAVKQVMETAKKLPSPEPVHETDSFGFSFAPISFDFGREEKMSEEELEEMLTMYEPYFVSQTLDQPYLQHGRLQQNVDTKEMLIGSLKKKLEAFVVQVGGIREVIQDVEELEKHIQEATGLPKTWKDSSGAIGMQQEVAMMTQVQTEQHVEVQTEVETEVDLELQQYEGIPTNELRKDSGFKRAQFQLLVQELKGVILLGGDVISLQEQLEKFEYGLVDERIRYENAFSEQIFGTEGYFYTCQGMNVLPVFHRLQKPPKQVLAVRNGENIRWVLLSEHEANSVREHLKELYQNPDSGMDGVWLIQLDGSLFVNGDHCEEFPIDEDSVQRGLIELNAFGGQADYLDKHVVESEEWLATETQLKIRFLKLRTARDSKQNQTLRRCPFILQRDEEAVHNPVQQVFKLRAEQEKKRQGRFNPVSIEEARALSPKKVRDLHVSFVPHLHTEDQLKMIQPFQVPFLTSDQMPMIPEGMIQHLEKPEQIYREEEGTSHYFLSQEQVKHLKKNQSHLIPFVNPECYGEFDQRWQARSVPPVHLDKIDASLWKFLRKDQLKQLPKEHEALVLNLSEFPRRFGWINGNRLSIISKEFLGYVIPEQIREITDPAVIKQLEETAKKNEGAKKIEEGQWTSWISANQVEYIDFDQQLQYLHTKEQIRKVSNLHVPTLDHETQVPLICDTQVPALVGKEQIQKCPNELVRYLKEDQLLHISDDQVPHLRGEEQVQKIMDPKKFKLLIPEQMQWISKDQYLLVPQDQIRGLNNDQLLEFIPIRADWKTLREGLIKEQVEIFNYEVLVNALSAKQINDWLPIDRAPLVTEKDLIQAFDDKFLPELKGDQLQWIKLDWVDKLDKNQLLALKTLKGEDWPNYQSNITKDQIESFDASEYFGLLSKEQIKEHLSEQQVRYLDKEWQIQAVKDDLVLLLDPETQVSMVSDDQVPKLVGKEQVGTIKDQYRFEMLIESQIQWMNGDQLKWITTDQLPELEKDQLLALKPLKGANWSDYQIKITKLQIASFDSSEYYDLLSQKQIQKLDKEHFVNLSAEQIAQLLPGQIGKMASKEESKVLFKALKKLSKDQIAAIKPQIVAHFDDGQVKTLQDDTKLYPLIQYIKPGQAHLIDKPEVLSHLTKDQLDEVKPAQVDNLNPNHPLWNRVSPDTIKGVSAAKVTSLAANQLKHLKTTEQIRAVSFWNVQHLTRDQLRKRSGSQFAVYMIGVITLGIVSSIAALIAYASLVPFIILLANRNMGRLAIKKINENPYRLYRFFEEYATPTKIPSAA